MAYQNEGGNRDVEALVDGMCSLLRKNFAAATSLIADAPAGSTLLNVGNTLRFDKGDEIVLMDDSCVWNEDLQLYPGIEFHVVNQVPGTTLIQLKRPTTKAFRVGDKARIQKALKNAFLWPKNVLYGDRETVCWDHIAICVEPDTRDTSWLAINGLSNDDWHLSLLVYVKMASAGENVQPEIEEAAQRTCNRYCDAIHRLLINNIHLDAVVEDVPLMRDAHPGDTVVWIPASVAAEWPADSRSIYDIQDNSNSNWNFALVNLESSSSSSTTYLTISSSSGSSSSTQGVGVSSSSSSRSTSSQVSSQSFSSSSSTYGDAIVPVYLNGPVNQHFKVSDKAVLRRNRRYFYDSLPSNATYGVVQKGEYLLKAGKISWVGKETQVVQFPQVGRGGSI